MVRIIIPIFSVIQDRVLQPLFHRGITTDLFQVSLCAGPWPILPFFDIAMFHRVVMDIIYRCAEMAIGFDKSFETIKPDLTAASRILSIPLIGRSPMKSSELISKLPDLPGPDQQVVMIG